MSKDMYQRLVNRSDETLINEEGEERIHPKPPRKLFRLSAALNLIVLGLLPIIYALGRRHGGEKLPRLPTHAVTKDIFKPQLFRLDDGFDIQEEANAKYKDLPRPELDDAWDGLVKHMNIRIHSHEAEQAGNFSSIELSDGSSDQMAMLTVFHNIHCLKTMREYLFPEHYPDTWKIMKPPFPGGISRHMDHCIDNLRQAVMCQSDLSLYTYRWLPGQDEPDVVTGMPHLCLNFDTVMDWASARSFSLNDRLLQSPYQDAPWDPHSIGT